MEKKPAVRNEQAAALRHRAGSAHVAVSVDTRPKSIPNRRKANDRKVSKVKLKRQPEE